MLKKYTYLLLSVSLAFIVLSCHSDVGDVNPDTIQTDQITVPLKFGEIVGELSGYIFDHDNNPISGAKVSIYSGETITNDYGIFTFNNAKLDPQGTFVKVEKSGFIIGSDFVYPNTNGKGTAKVKMLKIINEPAFQASEGGVVSIQGGGTLIFPPSSLIRANGSIYDGEVKSTAYRLSPSDADVGLQMAGGLLGIDTKGRHRVLSTYGIFVVELRGFDNQILRLKSDKSADLFIPIEPEIQSFVGEEVPAWNFDFNEGLWKEVNTTTNDKQSFTASIHSLGYWNIAIPSALSQVCGRLLYNNDLPAKNYEIVISFNGLPSRIGITDQDGYFCGKIPFGENLNFQVKHPTCGDILEEFIIGPFEDVGTIGDVVLNVDEKYLSGSIECSGDLNSNSTIVIESNDHTNIYYPDATGNFNINLEGIACGSSSSFTLFAYDNSTEHASNIINLTSDFSEALRIEVCSSECLVEATFRYEKDDYCIDGEYSQVFVVAAQGSGEYSYQWQDGSTNEYFNNPSSGEEICVKIVDEVTDCDYTFCEEVSDYKRLAIETIYSSNTECLITSGFIELDINGGKEPLVYSWNGPDGFTSDEAHLKDLAPGTYSLTIQDGGNCEVSESIDVYDVTTPIKTSKEDFCAKSIITIDENDGYKPYTYNWSAGEPIGNQLYVYTPGVYNLTVTDANMCSRSTSLTISKTGSLPIINPSFSCEVGVVTFSDLEPGFDYYYQLFGSNDKIPVSMFQGEVEIAILESGYRFEIGSENPSFSDCSVSESIDLPRFEGLQIESVNGASCQGCEDGHIEYTVNVDEECLNCTPGEAKVIRGGDGLDVTELNDMSNLENGEYFVVALDSENGCYIAHSLVVLE